MNTTTKTVCVAKPITINHIFSDRHNWNVFKFKHADDLREVEVAEVEKMLHCQDDDSGYFIFFCPGCKETKIVHLGCGSRVCTHCGKHFTDRWAAGVAENVYDVVHRHCVFTVPDVIWKLIRENRWLLKDLMDCAIKAVTKMMKKKLGKEVMPGIVAVLHTFGKDMKFNTHVHCLVTEGGIKPNGEWADVTYFPFELLRKYWKKAVLRMLKRRWAKTEEDKSWIESLSKKHSKGYYVRAKDRIKSKKEMIKYIGRYIRHPAIAESRIDSYDGENVIFHYVDNDDIKHQITMSVDEFIAAVIGHIPDRHFKVIRYYGIYARKNRKKYKKLAKRHNTYITMIQTDLTQYLPKLTPRCDKCGNLMQLMGYEPRKPPDERKFGSKITDWAYIK